LPLTDVGLRQADETGEKLKGLRVDLIVSSPLARCTQTAKRIADKIGYQGDTRIEPVLTERDFGVMSGELAGIAFAAIDTGNVEGLESLEDFAERMQRALELFKDLPGNRILVSGHSGAERMMRTLYEGRPYNAFLQTEVLHNGQIREYHA
jgi:broad specificity phosphatase PhoE